MDKFASTKIITHTDLDGFGCSIVSKLAFPYVNVQNCGVLDVDNAVINTLTNEIDFIDSLIIADLSVSNHVAKLLDSVSSEIDVKLLDHHKTSEHLKKYSWADVVVEYENGKKTCGCSLLYDFLKSNNILEENCADFVDMVRQYDIWEWSKTGNLQPKWLNILFNTYGPAVFTNKVFEKIKNNGGYEFDTYDLELIKDVECATEHYIVRKLNDVNISKINGYNVGIITADQHISDLGNRILKNNSEIDYAIILNPKSGQASFRGSGKLDLGSLAKNYGGGGHFDAAGCQIQKLPYEFREAA